jgi:hypothetical protein
MIDLLVRRMPRPLVAIAPSLQVQRNEAILSNHWKCPLQMQSILRPASFLVMIPSLMNMRKKRSREKLDWRKSIEEHPHQETAAEEMASLVSPRIRNPFYAAASIFGMIQNDIKAESAAVQRCPKCNHHSFRRLKPSEKGVADDSNWRCFRCGNDTDEFGNKL